MATRYDIPELRRRLADPARVLSMLGLRGRRTPSGYTIACPTPSHRDSTPSTSVRVGADGTMQWSCFGCGAGGDLITLTAAVWGLDHRRDLAAIAERLGAIELDADTMPTIAPLTPKPSPVYPDRDDVVGLWDAGRYGVDEDVAQWCASRGVDAEHAHRGGMLRCLPPQLLPVPVRGDACEAAEWAPSVPQWASSWWRRGYRVLCALWDAAGVMRSLRARRVNGGDGPKVLAPKGYAVAGLCLANLAAIQWSRGVDMPTTIVVVEGENDWLTASQRWPTTPVVGLVSGASWSPQWAAMVPEGATVSVWTDHDNAGDRYARQVAQSLRKRARVVRLGAGGIDS